MILFFRDLWLHLKRTICLFRRRHLREQYVGEFTKRGFRTVPIYQCAFCAEWWIKVADAKRLGGRPA